MLKRSKLLVAFLAVTVVCASIGFAAVQTTLTANGTAGVSADDLSEELGANVAFLDTGLTATPTLQGTANAGAEATIVLDTTDTDKDTLTLTIPAGILKAPGDKVTFKATIQNKNDQSVALAAALDSSVTVDSCITVTPTVADTVAANDTTELTVVVALASIPTDTITTSFKVVVTATPAE